MNPIAEILSTLPPGEAVSFRNLAFFPLLAGEARGPDHLTLDGALAGETARVTEVSSDGSVQELRFENGGAKMSSSWTTRSRGAKQDRILDVMPPHETLVIPLCCVEQGRRSYYRSPEFTSAGRTHCSRGRAEKAVHDVSHSLRTTGERRSDQGAVWDSIAPMACRHEADSPTGAPGRAAAACPLATEGPMDEGVRHRARPGDGTALARRRSAQLRLPSHHAALPLGRSPGAPASAAAQWGPGRRSGRRGAHRRHERTHMIGAIAGDIIGSAYEFRPTKSEDFPLFAEGPTFTDDTVLTVATADALLDRADYAAKYREWGLKYPDRRYGRLFLQWLRSPDPKPYRSYGNGSAMRVSPLGWAFDTLEEVLSEAERSAAVTHDHPEAIRGAQAAAGSVFLARVGEAKEGIRSFVENRIGYRLDRTLAEIRPAYRFDETCQGSIPEAITAFLEAESFEDTLRKAVSLGGDADTQASIAGGIAEAFYGGVPREILRKVLSRLTLDMGAVVGRFYRQFDFRSLERASEEMSHRQADTNSVHWRRVRRNEAELPCPTSTDRSREKWAGRGR